MLHATTAAARTESHSARPAVVVSRQTRRVPPATVGCVQQVRVLGVAGGNSAMEAGLFPPLLNLEYVMLDIHAFKGLTADAAEHVLDAVLPLHTQTMVRVRAQEQCRCFSLYNGRIAHRTAAY